MALAAFVARAAECDTLVEHAVIAHHGGLSDHDPHGVVDEQAPPDSRGGVDFDAGEKTGDLRENACEPAHAMVPQPVLRRMHPFGVQSRIGQEDHE